MTATVINATVNGYEVTGGNTAELVLQVGGQPAITINSNASWELANPLPISGGGTGSNTATFSGANITNLNASNVSSGVLAVARGGTGSNTATFSGANITDLNASSISTGTVGTARLGSGTANNTTYLRGDQTWATVSTTPTTDQVLSATAGASVGAIGTYGFFYATNGTTKSPGATLAGSSLRYANAITYSSTAPSGTWRLMGYTQGGTSINYEFSLWLRIS